jgi:hypothetical protein
MTFDNHLLRDGAYVDTGGVPAAQPGGGLC